MGDRFNGSSGSVATQVTKAGTRTALTISPNPATPGTAISYSAEVTVLPPGNVSATGTLQFTIDGVPVGAAVGLGNGVIGFHGTLTAPPGDRTYLVAVSYSGDENTEASSASVAVTIAAPAPPAGAPSAAPTAPRVSVARLNTMVSKLARALRLRGFAALTSTTQTLVAGAGVLDQKVYTPNAPIGARGAAAKPSMLASGRHRFARAGSGTLRLKLTGAGRRTIRRAKSLKIAIVTRYTPTGRRAIVATKRLTVRAKPKRRDASARGAGGWRFTWREVSR